jgi:hypothetical protein
MKRFVVLPDLGQEIHLVPRDVLQPVQVVAELAELAQNRVQLALVLAQQRRADAVRLAATPIVGSRCSLRACLASWAGSGPGPSAEEARGAGPGQAGQEIAARLHDMHAKSPLLKSGVDL